MQVQETEFYRTRNGAVMGPMRYSPSNNRFYIDGLKVAWDAEGRLLQSTVPEHPLDLVSAEVIVVDLPKDREANIDDSFGHLLEAASQFVTKGHFNDDLDNDMVVFSMRGFREFAEKTFLLGKGQDRIMSGLNKMAYEHGMQLSATVHLPLANLHLRSEVPGNTKSFKQFSDELIHKIAKDYGLPYSLIAGDLQKVSGVSFQEAMLKAAESVKRLSERLTAVRPAPGPGISRKGWPQIGTVWTHRNGNEYEVVQHANTEGTKPDYPATVIYRNTKNGKTYARRLNLWQPASFTFKRYPVQITNDMLDPFNEIPKRVYWDSEAGCFHRVSAHKGKVYPLPPEFTEAWRGRAKEFPVARKLQPYQKAVLKQFETTPQPESHVEKAFTTPRMRLTFPSLFAPRNGDRAEAKFSLDLSMPYGLKLDSLDIIGKDRPMFGEPFIPKAAAIRTVRENATLPVNVFYDVNSMALYRKDGEHAFVKMPDEFQAKWAYRVTEFPQFLYVPELKDIDRQRVMRILNDGKYAREAIRRHASMVLNEMTEKHLRDAIGIDKTKTSETLVRSMNLDGLVSAEKARRIGLKELERQMFCDPSLRPIPEGVYYQSEAFFSLEGYKLDADFHREWRHLSSRFPQSYEAAWDAVAGPKPPKSAYLRVDGKPLDTLAPGLRRFLDEIGSHNGYGELMGIMQKDRYEVTAQYRRRPSDTPDMFVEVVVNLPRFTTIKTGK